VRHGSIEAAAAGATTVAERAGKLRPRSASRWRAERPRRPGPSEAAAAGSATDAERAGKLRPRSASRWRAERPRRPGPSEAAAAGSATDAERAGKLRPRSASRWRAERPRPRPSEAPSAARAVLAQRGAPAAWRREAVRLDGPGLVPSQQHVEERAPDDADGAAGSDGWPA